MKRTWRSTDDTSATISSKVALVAYTNKGLRANIRVADGAITVLAKELGND